MLKHALLLAAFIAHVLVITHAESTHSAVKAAPRTDQGWKDRAKLLDDRVKDTPGAEVLFIGDSITHGWEGAGKETWEKYYAPRKAVNLGIGGDRTQHVLWRLEHAPFGDMKPKAAVIMIGTNNSNGEDNTPGQIADGVTAIVRLLGEKFPNMKVLVLAIFPRGENFNPQRGKVAQVNQVLQKLDDGKRVFFLDIGHRFLASDGLLPADIMPDYLHLSPKGYEMWAEAIEPKLAELLGGKAVAGADPSGDWSWSMKGPNDELIEQTLTLKASDGKLAGTFHVSDERKLQIEKGTVSGIEIKFVVRRNRPQGGEMVYIMTGTIEGDRIKGKTKTEIEGAPVEQDWSARRK